MKNIFKKLFGKIKMKGSDYGISVLFAVLFITSLAIDSAFKIAGIGIEMSSSLVSIMIMLIAFYVFYLSVEDRKAARQARIEDRERHERFMIEVLGCLGKKQYDWYETFDKAMEKHKSAIGKSK